MKYFTYIKRIFAATALVLAVAAQSLANESQIIWVKAVAYPTGAGTVYVDYGLEGEKTFEATSEFKRHSNGAISSAFIWSQPAEGWQLAGYVRDSNKNGEFDNDISKDRQVKVNANGFFTAVYDPTVYKGNSTSEADAAAEEAMQEMTSPTDLVFAVFTKGAIARAAVGQETHGKVYSSKLYTEAGDEVTFSAYGDSDSQDSGVKYYKFDHWTDADGNTVGIDRRLTVTVKGGDIYYAHFVETTSGEFKETEHDPNYYDPNDPEASKLKGDVNSDGTVDVADISAIINVMAGLNVLDTAATDNADVNGDGQVDVADISAVINIMAGN